MSDALEKNLWVGKPKVKKAEDPEVRVEEALAKALEATTPEHPGTPWEKQEKEPSDQRYYNIPEAQGDA